MPIRLGGILVQPGRRHILLRGRGMCPGVIFGFEPAGRCRRAGPVLRHDPEDCIRVVSRVAVSGAPGRFGMTALQRQLPLPQFGFRLLCLLFRFAS